MAAAESDGPRSRSCGPARQRLFLPCGRLPMGGSAAGRRCGAHRAAARACVTTRTCRVPVTCGRPRRPESGKNSYHDNTARPAPARWAIGEATSSRGKPPSRWIGAEVTNSRLVSVSGVSPRRRAGDGAGAAGPAGRPARGGPSPCRPADVDGDGRFASAGAPGAPRVTSPRRGTSVALSAMRTMLPDVEALRPTWSCRRGAGFRRRGQDDRRVDESCPLRNAA